jgi:hypothetical protein
VQVKIVVNVISVIVYVLATVSTIAKSLLVLRKGVREPDVADSLDLSPAEVKWHYERPNALRRTAWMMLVLGILSLVMPHFSSGFCFALGNKPAYLGLREPSKSLTRCVGLELHLVL